MQPLSALGSLTVEARDIVQDGNLWAPFGQIELQADDSLVFKDGSLTSVAAAPGSLTPVRQGRERPRLGRRSRIGPRPSIKQDDWPEKSIRTEAASVDMQAGAKIDLAGGGDLQAYEFTVGPGGSRDILADKNTYAILPGYAGGFAPGDAQERFRPRQRRGGVSLRRAGAGRWRLHPAACALRAVARRLCGQARHRHQGRDAGAGLQPPGRRAHRSGLRDR